LSQFETTEKLSVMLLEISDPTLRKN